MKQYVVDAFTDKVFSGNPAAVCVLDKPLSDELMQKITTENNLSETAFLNNEANLGNKFVTRNSSVNKAEILRNRLIEDNSTDCCNND